MRTLLKKVLFPLLKPLAYWYLSKNRKWSYSGLRFKVFPGVFHPGLFFSTKIMMDYLSTLNLKGQSLLEIGCGSGAISLWATRLGAKVTAVDLNPRAVENTQENALKNDLFLDVLVSDLAANLGEEIFQLIVVNPPYYPKEPANAEELAWYCGKDFEFFSRLFEESKRHLSQEGKMFMILSEDCALEKIEALANSAGWSMKEVHRKSVWAEMNFIFCLTLRN